MAYFYRWVESEGCTWDGYKCFLWTQTDIPGYCLRIWEWESEELHYQGEFMWIRGQEPEEINPPTACGGWGLFMCFTCASYKFRTKMRALRDSFTGSKEPCLISLCSTAGFWWENELKHCSLCHNVSHFRTIRLLLDFLLLNFLQF